MIVVVGQPVLRQNAAGAQVGGLAGRIAVAAASHGRGVQLVGTAGEDKAGDDVLLALASSGVGHVAVLRKAGQPTALEVAAGEAPLAEDQPGAGLDEDVEADGGAAQPFDAIPLDAGDVDLALRYLPDFSVLVVADPADSETVLVVAGAASWAGAHLIVIVPGGAAVPAGAPDDAIVFEAPETNADAAFATMVGAFAAALDDGDDVSEAFRTSVSSSGWVEAPAEPEATG